MTEFAQADRDDWLDAEDFALRSELVRRLHAAMQSEEQYEKERPFLNTLVVLYLDSLNDDDRSDDRPERYVVYITRRGRRFARREVVAQHDPSTLEGSPPPAPQGNAA